MNTDPYGDGWMIKMRSAIRARVDELMTAEEYDEYIRRLNPATEVAR